MTTNINANPLDIGTDELERYALEESVKRQRIDHRVSVLLASDRRGELAIKFAHVGAQVTVADDPQWQADVAGRVLAAGFRDEVVYAPALLDRLPEALPGQPFDIAVVRRGLCSMPYVEASRVVRQLLLKLKIGGKLYVSVLGLHSELGDGYATHDTPIEDRFAPLAPAVAKKYDIQHPVCLYTERNLFMLLIEAGASVLRTQTTTYGNVKGIAVRV